ncbi:MAG: hypothetical protein LBE08_13950 [Bifidobacteriaceae bacterium]|nr:hypothetical protein [Bifidobacteriaceae bacterium]
MHLVTIPVAPPTGRRWAASSRVTIRSTHRPALGGTVPGNHSRRPPAGAGRHRPG